VHLLPILYVSDVERAVGFFRAFGYDLTPGAHSDEIWAELAAGDGATLALHMTDKLPDDVTGRDGRLQLSLRTGEPLEDLIARLRDTHGLEPHSAISEEPFGRLVVYRDPDGFEVDVVEPPGASS
jgi:catechol 2,3-dioxygenase-like lactoylglutathione lyase family enzyme